MEENDSLRFLLKRDKIVIKDLIKYKNIFFMFISNIWNAGIT